MGGGILHSEPMEFGYDLTDLSSGFDMRRPLKYFFIIESKSKSVGKGKLYHCSVLDYEFDQLGIETIFDTGNELIIRKPGKTYSCVCNCTGRTFFCTKKFTVSGWKNDGMG